LTHGLVGDIVSTTTSNSLQLVFSDSSYHSYVILEDVKDVVDNFRAVHLSIGDSGKLIPDPAFREQFDANIQKLMDHVSSLTADNDAGEDNAH
jgi:hypothetical protein